MAQEVNEALVESETTTFNQGGGRAERFENAVNAIINRHSRDADRASFWKWYNTFYTWTLANGGGITRRHAFLKCFSFNQDVNNQFDPADYRWAYKNSAETVPAENKNQVARYFWGGANIHTGLKGKSRYYPQGPTPDRLEHKHIDKQNKKEEWDTVDPKPRKGTPCWKFIAYYFDKKFVHGQDGLKYFIDILNRAWREAQQNQAAVNQFVQAQNNVPDESKSGGADEEHDAIPPADDNGNQNQPLIRSAKQEFFNEYDVDGPNEYAPVINHDYGYNHYYYPQQQQPQLLLSPQVIPVQYGVNGINNMNNNGVNHDYYVSNEWLFVLLPILLIGACLFGIICMFLMGFGGLFCYREGKKARVLDERGGFYRKLPQKDDIDMNKRDRGLVHYDESV